MSWAEAPTFVPAARPTPKVHAPQQGFGAWGKAPSSLCVLGDLADDDTGGGGGDWQTAASRNAKKKQAQREFGAWGKAPSVSASSVRRNNDSWSVSARSVAGDHDDARSVAASDDGNNWGRPPSVVGQAGRSWADQMEEEDEANAAAAPDVDDDARSVAASTTSGWGSASAGPW
ncbi:hypothetical protein FKP32DRAFT_1678196 [Trametes sanguinea]|nr:hypothetical protein FKP32DRAFT_1678196 [Trametes sanguinea]